MLFFHLVARQCLIIGVVFCGTARLIRPALLISDGTLFIFDGSSSRKEGGIPEYYTGGDACRGLELRQAFGPEGDQ